MINFDNIPKIYLVEGIIDFRKGIDGYTNIIQDNYKLNPYEDAMFIFINKHKDKIKIIYYDTNGFWLLYKRLETGKFKLKRNDKDDCITITHQQLKWLLEGLSIHQKSSFKPTNYKYV